MAYLDGEREKGTLLVSDAYTVDGKKTAATILSPVYVGESPPCLQQGGAKVTWTTVDYAEAYMVDFRELICPPNDDCYAGPLHTSERITTNQGGGSMTETFRTATAPLDGGADAIGFYVYVTALGPDDMPGYITPYEVFMLQPEGPRIDAPPAWSHLYNDTELLIRWYSPLSHGGKYIVEIHDGDSCSNLRSDFIIEGFSSGFTVMGYDTTMGWLNQHDVRSFRVRPWIYDGCDMPRHSECVPCSAFNGGRFEDGNLVHVSEICCSDLDLNYIEHNCNGACVCEPELN